MDTADIVIFALLVASFGYLIYRDRKNDKKFKQGSPSYREQKPQPPQQER